MKTSKLTNIVQKYIGAPYKLGGQNPEEGFDCLSLLYCILQDFGIGLPKSYAGFTLNNYIEKWKAGEGQDLFLDFVSSLGNEISLKYISAGDILLIKQDFVFPVIYLGNMKILIVLEEFGTRVIPIKAVKSIIKAVRIM